MPMAKSHDFFQARWQAFRETVTQDQPPLLVALWRVRRLIVLGAVLGAVVGLAVAVSRPHTFTASATLMFPNPPSLGGLSSLRGGPGNQDWPGVPVLNGAMVLPQPGTSSSGAILLLASYQTRQRVAERLAKSFDPAAAWPGEPPTTVLLKQSDFDLGRQSELYVRFTDTDRKRAKLVVEAMVAELQERQGDLKLGTAKDIADVLRAQSRKAESDLLVLRQKFIAFRRAHRLVSVDAQAQALAQRYTDLQKDLATSELESKLSELRLQRTTTAARTLIARSGLSAMGTGPGDTLQTLYERLAGLQTDLAILRTKLQPRHPDLQPKEAEIAVVKQALRDEVRRQLTLVDSQASPAVAEAALDHLVTRARVQGLKSALTSTGTLMDSLPALQDQFTELTAELEAQTDVVKLYREELAKADVLASLEGPVFVVIDPAIVPPKSNPRGGMMMALVCLFCGGGLVASVVYGVWLCHEYQIRGACSAPPADRT